MRVVEIVRLFEKYSIKDNAPIRVQSILDKLYEADFEFTIKYKINKFAQKAQSVYKLYQNENDKLLTKLAKPLEADGQYETTPEYLEAKDKLLSSEIEFDKVFLLSDFQGLKLDSIDLIALEPFIIDLTNEEYTPTIKFEE